MKLGVQILGLLAVTTVVACGRVETKQKKDNTPADTTADDDKDSGTTKKPGKTVPTKTTGPTGPTNTNSNSKCASATSAKDYTGNVAGFRKSNSASRAKVKLQNVVVTAISGDSDAITYYVADAAGGEYSGVRVACGKKSECGAVPTALGQRVTVDGEAAISDDCATIGVSAPKFSAGTGAAMLPELLLVPSEKLGSIAGTETIRGVKVAANDSEFTVSNARPQALQNANYKGTTCETDGKGCCSNGGPKYFGFEVTSKAGKKFYVTTDNYISKANPGGFSKTSWPCDGKFERAVKTGDKFPGIAGIFDIRSGKAQLAPTTDSDLASHVGPAVPTGPTQPTGPTGTPTEECHDLPVTNPMCTECIECCTGSSCEQLCDCPADQNTNYCQSCEYKADCGDDAVFCLDDGQGNGFCGKYCDTDADCRQDSFCAEIGGIDANDQSVTVGWNCVPADNSCAQ